MWFVPCQMTVSWKSSYNSSYQCLHRCTNGIPQMSVKPEAIWGHNMIKNEGSMTEKMMLKICMELSSCNMNINSTAKNQMSNYKTTRKMHQGDLGSNGSIFSEG